MRLNIGYAALTAAMIAAPLTAQAAFVYPDQLPILSGAFGSSNTVSTVDLAGPPWGRLTSATGTDLAALASIPVPPNLDMWVQRNIATGGAVGVTTHYPRDSLGSAYFAGDFVVGGPTNRSGKADLEYWFSTPRNLGDLTDLKYDWYRDSASTNPAAQHPVIRLWVQDASTPSVFGYVVYEGVYNGQPTAPTDTWVTADVDAAIFWATSSLGAAGTGTVPPGTNPRFDFTLADWNALQGGDLLVLGLSVGIGSGWVGSFDGAVDNIMVAFTGANAFSESWNFEVPEPGTLALFGLGVLGAVAMRRRRADDAAPVASAVAA